MANVPAILGGARLGNFKLGYESTALARLRSTRVTVLIAGVLANSRVWNAGMSIRDVLDDAPNTASFDVKTTAPTDGQDVRISINSDTPRLLFNGTLQTTDLTYQGRPIAAQTVWPCSAIDDIARLNQKRPFGTWVDTSVTTIAQSIITSYAPGFTSAHVQASLPTVSIVFDGTEDFSTCLGRLATAVGGYFYVEDLDLHLFQTEATDTPDPIQAGYAFADDPPIVASVDQSQVRNRVYGKGHGEVASLDVLAGETIIPIADSVMFNPLGGRAIAGTTPDGAQSQLLTYTGVQALSGGALVGPGVTPGVAPVEILASGAGLSAGLYTYAYTWVTAAGETLSSPLGTVTTGDTVDPSAGPTAVADLSGWSTQAGLAVGDTVQLALSFSYDSANTIGVTDLTVGGSIIVPVWSGGGGKPAVIKVSATFTPPTFAQYYHLWVSKNGAAYRREVSNPASGGHFGPIILAFFNLGSVPPAVNRVVHQVALSGIAIGPSGTTSRKIYRTTVGGAQLKLQQTIANNSATVGVTDVTADGSLGANAPVSDTAGLTATVGQVNAGSTSMPTSGAGPFSAAGGWFLTYAGDLVRYAGISGNTLTGIPAAGVGAILTSIIYSSPITPVPALTGVSGLTLAMQRGTPIHLWVQRDDLGAQADQIALDAAQGRVSDGVIEGPPIVDERRGEASLTALCDATLALFSRPIVTVTYATRDTKTKSGKSIVVNLTNPPISQTLTIQEVTITEIDVSPGIAPKFTVTASTVRQSLDAILRQLIAKN